MKRKIKNKRRKIRSIKNIKKEEALHLLQVPASPALVLGIDHPQVPHLPHKNEAQQSVGKRINRLRQHIE